MAQVVLGVLSLCLVVFIAIIPTNSAASVTELDDRILETKNHEAWLVEFYAPWCGHCQKLAPVWIEVGSKMAKNHPHIHVGKLDGTKHSSVMDHFDVRGFPTIKYVSGDRLLTHRGGRTTKDIIDFALRAHGPAVRKISKATELKQAGKEQKPFFLLVTKEEEEESELEKLYSQVAETKILDSFYYLGPNKVLPSEQRIPDEDLPVLMVLKDKTKFIFQGTTDVDSITAWVMEERFPAFPLIENGNVNHLAQLEKFLVLALVNPSVDNHKKHPHYIMKDTVRKVAENFRDKYHKTYQFGYMEHNDIINDITLSRIEIPGLIVVDPVTYLFYLFVEPVEKLTEETLMEFLDDIIDGKIEAIGGNSWYRKIYRVFYEIVRSLVALWMSSPILTTGLLVVPSFLIIFICYSIWSAEPFDEDNLPPDSEEELEEGEEEERAKVVELEDEDGDDSQHLKTA